MGADNKAAADAARAPAGNGGASPDKEAVARRYWSANVRLLLILLAVWFAVSFGAGILFVDTLNTIEIGGFKLGFWFAQQGSIYVFVVLIFIYTWQMHRTERRLGVDDD